MTATGTFQHPDLQDQLQLLDRATAHLAESIEPEKTFPNVARVAIPALADFCLFDLVEGEQLRRVAWAHVDPARQAQWAERVVRLVPELSASAHPIVKALTTGQTILEPAVSPDWFDESPSLTPAQKAFYKDVGVNSVLVVPLESGGRVLGTLSLGYSGLPYRTHTEAQKHLAEELARRAALAIENARHYEAARSAVQAGEQVLAMVSHDLRNPLSTIDLVISGLLDEEGAAPFRRQLEMAHRAAQRMEALITDLLDMASIEAGKLTVDLRTERIGQLVDELVEIVTTRATSRGISVECQHALGEATVRCDRARILQALGNIAGNAVKYSRPGDHVSIRGWTTERAVTIEIADTGPGIPAAEVPHLFERYWTVARGAQRGTGLGLFIMKRIVDAHHGSVTIDTAPGRGSTFQVTLPRSPVARPLA